MNATVMVKTFPEKRMHNFTRNKTTLEFINALHEEMAVTPISVTADYRLFITNQEGNDKNEQGTWFQRNLALEFTLWLNPKYGVWCKQRIDEIITKGFSALTYELCHLNHNELPEKEKRGRTQWTLFEDD